MQAVTAGCGIPDQVSYHVCPVTKDVQQALLALVLLVLTTYAHGSQGQQQQTLCLYVEGGVGGLLPLLPHYASHNSSEGTTATLHSAKARQEL